jgi:uncharacterized OB-fold protein
VSRTARPDLSALEIPMDAWTEPFWAATARGELLLPRCGECGRFRWPVGPFCPACHSQALDWVPAGDASVYSYTLVPDGDAIVAPALIAFAAAPGIRIPAAIVETEVSAIRIGAILTVDFSTAKNAQVPVFGFQRVG